MQHAIGISPPTNFPDRQYGELLAKVQSHCEAHGRAADLATFAEAWNGMAYRYSTASAANAAYTDSVVTAGTTPPPLDRYAQERDLFSFFTCALSVLETFGRAADVLGRLAGAQFATRPRPYPKDVARAFRAAYPGDRLTTELDAVTSSQRFVDLNETRNALSHGGAPPRRAYVGSAARNPEWGALTIDANTTREFHDWMDGVLADLTGAAEEFANARL